MKFDISRFCLRGKVSVVDLRSDSFRQESRHANHLIKAKKFCYVYKQTEATPGLWSPEVKRWQLLVAIAIIYLIKYLLSSLPTSVDKEAK